MRGKKAKQLRRMAKDMATGEDVAYNQWSPPQYKRIKDMVFKTAKGIPCVLAPNCTRAIYQQLKRS